jgi:hypothetical protein
MVGVVALYICGVCFVVARMQHGPRSWRTTGIFTIWEWLPVSVIIVFGLSRRLHWRYVLTAAVIGFNIARFLSFRLPVAGPFLAIRTWYPIGSACAAAVVLFGIARLVLSAAKSIDSPFFIDRLKSKLTAKMGEGSLLRFALIEAAVLGYVFAPKRLAFRPGCFGSKILPAGPDAPDGMQSEAEMRPIRGDSYSDNNKQHTFTMWERNGQRSTINAIVGVLVVETVALHVALSFWVNQVVAGFVTALSVYSMLWLIGHARATRAHPLLIDKEYVRIRVGLQTTIDIPREFIAVARGMKIDGAGFDGSSDDTQTLRAVPFGSGNIELLLTEPVAASTFRGRRLFQRVIVCCDEPAKFLAVVSAPSIE